MPRIIIIDKDPADRESTFDNPAFKVYLTVGFDRPEKRQFICTTKEAIDLHHALGKELQSMFPPRSEGYEATQEDAI